MKHLHGNFKSNVPDKLFYIFKLSDTPYTREQLFSGLSEFKNFMDKFNLSVDEFSELIDELCIVDKELFDYGTFLKNDFLVAKNGVYIEQSVKVGYTYKIVRKNFDVYVCEHEYLSLSLEKVINRLMLKRYPFLGKKPFLKEERRFHDNINELPISTNTLVENIDDHILFDNNITIDDLFKLYTDPSYKDSIIEKPIWKVYLGTDIICFSVDESKGDSIIINLDDFINGNWNAVKERIVHGVCLYDDDGNLIQGKWFSGKQKDAPYFRGHIIEELRRVMEELKK